MTDKQIIIDEYICDYYSDTREDEEGANPIIGWCNDNDCKCKDIPFDECLVKAIQYCKLKDKQLQAKEQEVDVLKAENERLKQAFEESDNDCFRLEKENRLLKVYRSITPLKVKKLVQTLNEIKEIAKLHAPRCNDSAYCDFDCDACHLGDLKQILSKISEVVDEN